MAQVAGGADRRVNVAAQTVRVAGEAESAVRVGAHFAAVAVGG